MIRIEFLTQDDPLYILPFFEEFVCSYAGEFDILHVSTSPTMGKRPRSQLLRELMELYGVTGLIRLVARAGIARAFGSFSKEPNADRYHSLAQLCRAYRITHQKIADPNEDSYLESVRRRSPDVLISVACPYILKEPLLAVAKLGNINIHHAPLPRYKGMMPTFWQMFHGEKSVGVTVHYMTPKIDEGNILLQEEHAINPGESLDHLIQRSKRHGAHCMARVLRALQTGAVSPKKTDNSQGSYFTFPTIEQIREFRRRGYRAI